MGAKFAEEGNKNICEEGFAASGELQDFSAVRDGGDGRGLGRVERDSRILQPEEVDEREADLKIILPGESECGGNVGKKRLMGAARNPGGGTVDAAVADAEEKPANDGGSAIADAGEIGGYSRVSVGSAHAEVTAEIVTVGAPGVIHAEGKRGSESLRHCVQKIIERGLGRERRKGRWGAR